jgi:hypothetical protein
MPHEDARNDSYYSAQREADSVEAGRYPERDSGADANDEPQTRETLLQRTHRFPVLVVKRPYSAMARSPLSIVWAIFK